MSEPDFYDRLWADEWKELPSHGPLSHTRQRLVLRELGDRLRPSARLLDVGCGDGTFLANVRAHHPGVELRGIDFSGAACAAAPASLRPRLEVGDVERLRDYFASGAFDLATSIEVLEHVVRPEAVLRGMVEVVRPGGLVVLTVPHGMRHWSDLDDAGGHRRRFELSELRALMAACGLEPRRVYAWGGPLALPYYALTKRLGARRVSSAAKAGSSRLAARVLQALFRFDDLFPSRLGFQLIASGRRPEERA